MSSPRPHLLCERHEAAVYEWVVMEGGGEVGICWSGSGVFSPSSNIGSSSLTCSNT